jgi:hypothetical protein
MWYREDMDEQKCTCGRPACEDPMRIVCKECGSEKLLIGYFNGMIAVYCDKCDHIVVKLAVARRNDEISRTKERG